ncbi:hypothetical protein [Pseudoalteromonas lipolytica]
MMGYQRGQEFLNEFGGIESILFFDDDSVLLSGDNAEKGRRLIKKQQFDKYLQEHKFLPNSVEKPKLDLTKYQQRTRDDRLLYLQVLKVLVTEGLKPTVPSTYDELIKRVEKLHPHTQATTHPKRTTLCKQWKKWCNSDFYDDVLACKRRVGRTRINSASEALLNHHTSTVYSDSNSTYKGAFYRDYCELVKEHASSNSDIYAVSERTYSRRLDAIREQERILNIKGLTQAERNQRLLTLKRKIRTYCALQRVECDRVCINMSLIDDDTGLPTPPLSLYAAIDVYTRCIIGVVLSFNAENKEDGFNLIRQIYMDDDNLPMHGKPFSLVLDNGAGFNNELMQKTCEELRVSNVYSPSNQPAKKPFIESFFKTLRADFFRGFKIEDKHGKVTIGFNSYKGKRTDKNTVETESLQKLADIKVSDFKRLLNIFLSEYSHKLHREAGHVPIEAWIKSKQGTPYPEYNYTGAKSAFHVFTDKPKHKLQPAGKVYLLKQTFTNPNGLKTLYNILKVDALGDENPDVSVFFDPFDARHVTVQGIDPQTGEVIRVSAYNVECYDYPAPISFDELNGYKPKSVGIYQDTKHEITGHYKGKIDSFFKQKRRKPPARGPKTPSFDENNAQLLTAQERIAVSHSIDSKSKVSIRPNIQCLEQEDNKNASKQPKDTVAKDSYDKDQLW